MTDWPQIVGLYDALLRVEPSPVVALNRAVAVAMREQGDDLARAGREVHRAGRNGIYDVCVTNGAGELVAQFRGHSRTVKGTHLPA